MSCYGGNFFSGVAFLIYSNQISSGSTFDLERQKAFWKIDIMIMQLLALEPERDIVQRKQNV